VAGWRAGRKEDVVGAEKRQGVWKKQEIAKKKCALWGGGGAQGGCEKGGCSPENQKVPVTRYGLAKGGAQREEKRAVVNRSKKKQSGRRGGNHPEGKKSAEGNEVAARKEYPRNSHGIRLSLKGGKRRGREPKKKPPKYKRARFLRILVEGNVWRRKRRRWRGGRWGEGFLLEIRRGRNCFRLLASGKGVSLALRKKPRSGREKFLVGKEGVSGKGSDCLFYRRGGDMLPGRRRGG